MLLTIKNLRNVKVSIQSLRLSVPASGEKSKRFFDDLPEQAVDELVKLQQAGHISYTVEEDPDTPDEFEDAGKDKFDAATSTLTNSLESANDQSSLSMLALQNAVRSLEKVVGAMAEGDAALNIYPGALAEDIEVGDLNGAAAGELIKKVGVKLVTSEGLLHGWANFVPTVTPAYVPIATGTGGAPTCVKPATPAGTPQFEAGYLTIDVVMDTDAGATKIYEIGDIITVTIDVSGLSLLSGVGTLIKTYTVIADT